jgi:hypothetical protein
MLFRHRKTGKMYRHLAHGTDCTNSRDGTSVVVYCPDDNEHTIYVRDTAEFHEKFEMVMPPACKCFTDEQRKYCKQKRECVKIEAHSNAAVSRPRDEASETPPPAPRSA